MTDATLIIQSLLEAEPIRQPVMRSVIQTLQLPPGSRGLDAGCGIGFQSLLLAEAVGAEGHITGVDIVPELLSHAGILVGEAGYSKQIAFREADMNQLPFPNSFFDWVWSADCAGYPAGDLLPVIKELVRVVKPGGSIIILGWSSQQVLPGYPFLEARLNATCSSYLPFLQGKSPHQHFMRSSNFMREAGLEQVKAQTFVGNIQAPLGEDIQTAMAALFQMLWGQRQPECSPEDWDEWQCLCKPGIKNFILNLPDYYAFFTYTMFRGIFPFA